MAEQLYATSSLSGSWVNPANANGNTPTTWAGELNTNTSVSGIWALGDPSNPLLAGAGLQTISVWAKKGSNSGVPTIALNLYENGSLVQALVSATNVTSTTGETISGTFNGNVISDESLVEVEVVMTAAAGSPSVRNSAQIAYILWDATVTAPTVAPADLTSASQFDQATIIPTPKVYPNDATSATEFDQANVDPYEVVRPDDATSASAFDQVTISDPVTPAELTSASEFDQTTIVPTPLITPADLTSATEFDQALAKRPISGQGYMTQAGDYILQQTADQYLLLQSQPVIGEATDQRDTAAGVGVASLSETTGAATDQRDTASGTATYTASASGAGTDQRDTASGTALSEPQSGSSSAATDQRDTATGTATHLHIARASGSTTDRIDISTNNPPWAGSGGGGGGDFAIGLPGRYRDLLELEDDDEEILEIMIPLLGHVLPQLWMAYLRQTQSNR